jgi:hypothetical protein
MKQFLIGDVFTFNDQKLSLDVLRRLVSRIQCALHPLGVRGQPQKGNCVGTE